MASIFLRRPFALGLGLSTAFAAHAAVYTFNSRPLLCESVSPGAFRNYQDAKAPVVKGRRINPAAYKQISSGSILGLLGGLAVSTFSKTLAFVIGLMVVGSQYLASKGIHIIPTQRLQKYVKGIDLRSALEDNVAFKLSFGTTFMLATLGEF